MSDENKPKHTPGPWMAQVIEGKPCTPIMTRQDLKNGNEVASVIMESHPNVPNPCGKANAALIAAAPELLEALKKLEARVDWFLSEDFGRALGINYNPLSEEFFELEQARAAIAKAEGK